MTQRGRAAWLLPVCAVLGMVWSCSSDSATKKTNSHYDAGSEAGEGGAATGGGAGRGGSAGAGGKASGGTSAQAGEGGESAGSGATAEGGAAGADTNGSAGEGGAAPEFHGLYVSPTGKDTNGGTEDAPFATFAAAIAKAMPGDTVLLLDGTYTGQPTATVPDGVNVAAAHVGLAKIACSFGRCFTFSGSSHIDGIEFDNDNQAITATTSGTLEMSNLYLVNGGIEGGVINLGGTVKATFSAPAGFPYTNGGHDTFYVHDTASLTVTGGVFQNLINGSVTGNAAVRVGDSATVVLQNVAAVDLQQSLVSTATKANVTLDHVTADVLYGNVLLVRDESIVTINTSHLAEKPLAPSHGSIVTTTNFTGSISVADSELTGGSGAFQGQLGSSLTITGSNIHDNLGLAIDASNNTSSTVSIANTQITGNGSLQTQLHGPMRIQSAILNLKLRGVTFKNNGINSANGTPFNDYYGINITGNVGSSYDFGTLTDPGLNTFLTNGVSGVALTIQGPAGLTVPAIGNTWIPNVQGADANGKYAAPAGVGMTLDITGPKTAAANSNYALATTTVLRLAQNPSAI